MFRNLSPERLGISGRQNEIIELTLSYGFKGMDLDIEAFHQQVQLRGLESAQRFIQSAKIKIGGFKLPVRWQEDESAYRADMQQLAALAEMAAGLGATRCHTLVEPACDDKPYHEKFEFQRHRIAEMAEVLAPLSIRLGLDFLAPAHHREGKQFQYISTPDALLLLCQTSGASNVGVVVDLWQWHVAGASLDQLRGMNDDQIVMVRLSDAPDQTEAAGLAEEQRLLPMTTGVIDAATAVVILKDIGYLGPVSPSAHNSQFSGQSRDATVRQAGEAMKATWEASTAEPSQAEPQTADASAAVN